MTVWSAPDVLTVPNGALFRQADRWAVYAVQDGPAQIRAVSVGQRNNRLVEITDGLAAGEQVVLHPSDRVRGGVRVLQREAR